MTSHVESKLGRHNTNGSLMDVLGVQDQPTYEDAMKMIQSRYSIKKKVDGGGKKDTPEQKEEEGSQATDGKSKSFIHTRTHASIKMMEPC